MHRVAMALLTAVLLAGASTCRAEAPSADEWVARLGDADFAVRERAERELTALGAAAQNALRTGVKARDLEVRFRSRRLLNSLSERLYLDKLDSLLADEQGRLDHDLPGWKIYREEIGRDREARALFVKMAAAEPELFAGLDRPATRISADAIDMIEHAAALINPGPRDAETANLAAMLFVGGLKDVRLSDQAGTQLCSFCQRPQIAGALRSNGRASPLRKLVVRWLNRAEGEWTVHECLQVALRYELPEGPPIALRALRGDVSSSRSRAMAILTLIKLGDKSHAEAVETCLNDASICSPGRDPFGAGVQLRDVALAGLLHLYGEDPARHGFANLQRHDATVYALESLSLDNEEARNAALHEWRKLKAGAAQPAG